MDVSQGSLLLSHIDYLYTGDEEVGELRDAGVFVMGNVIQWVGRMAELPEEALQADRVLDLKGQLVTPGMINTHHHLFQSLTKGCKEDGELFDWLTYLYGIWQHLQPHQMHISALMSMAELMMSGCTLTTDHAYIYPNECKIDDLIQAARDIGIRFQPVRGAMSLGQSNGGLPPDNVTEDEASVLEDCERILREYHDPRPFAMLRIALGPCSPFSVTRQLMKDTAALARRYKGVRLHTHLSENFRDLDYHAEVLQQTPGEYITECGWNQDDCWFAHCVLLSDDEICMFSKAQCGVAHCPSSNMRLASGVAPIEKLVAAGVPVGIGVDGAASNDTSNLVAEARLAMLAARIREFRPPTQDSKVVPGNPMAMDVRTALKLATVGGARCLGRQDEVGMIRPGMAADIVAWEMQKGVGFAGAQHDPVAGLLLSAAWGQYCSYNIVNGRVIIEDGKFVTIDLEAVIQKHNAASKELFAAAGVKPTCS